MISDDYFICVNCSTIFTGMFNTGTPHTNICPYCYGYWDAYFDIYFAVHCIGNNSDEHPRDYNIVEEAYEEHDILIIPFILGDEYID